MPRVSTIIPAYNAAKYVRAAVESALAQTYTDNEIIVVDDGSTDETPLVLEAFGPKITFLRQQNAGVSAARNKALSVASGEFVAYLDADDVWHPEKLAKQVEFLDSHPACGMVHTDVHVIDAEGAVVTHAFNRTTGRAVPQGRCTMDLLRRSHVQLLTVMARHEAVRAVGGFDERLMSVEDYFQWILISLDGWEVGYLDEPLAMYRWAPGSISSNEKRMRAQLIRLFEILLSEKELRSRCGPEAVRLAKERLYEKGRELAYLERSEGDLEAARRRIRRLIAQFPLRPSLYADLARSFVPRSVVSRLKAPLQEG